MEIVNCYNIANIIGEKAVGGILGTSTGANLEWIMDLKICNSYNIGKINGKGTVGGILGEQGGICNKNYVEMRNVYNGGELIGNNCRGILAKISKDYRAELKTSFKNVFYIDDYGVTDNCIYDGTIFKKTKEEIKSSSFVNILNNNIEEENIWKKWTLGEEGYPTFVE